MQWFICCIKCIINNSTKKKKTTIRRSEICCELPKESELELCEKWRKKKLQTEQDKGEIQAKATEIPRNLARQTEDGKKERKNYVKKTKKIFHSSIPRSPQDQLKTFMVKDALHPPKIPERKSVGETRRDSEKISCPKNIFHTSTHSISFARETKVILIMPMKCCETTKFHFFELFFFAFCLSTSHEKKLLCGISCASSALLQLHSHSQHCCSQTKVCCIFKFKFQSAFSAQPVMLVVCRSSLSSSSFQIPDDSPYMTEPSSTDSFHFLSPQKLRPTGFHQSK